LADWFVGASDYIHLMDRINGTDAPINYSFMTYTSVASFVAERGVQYTYSNSWSHDPPGGQSWSESTKHSVTWSGTLEVKYELRVSMTSLLAGVSTYSGQNLKADQATILGALFSKYTKSQ